MFDTDMGEIMMIQPIPHFQAQNTHHCVTGSMRHIYSFNQHDISEEMLLGLGQGVGFIYWHQKGGIPFLGGRAMPKPSMEELAGRRTGVAVTGHTTTSVRKARKVLLDRLTADQPIMLQVDMGFLPYFDFEDTDYHFGGHVVVACGYDENKDYVLVADRDGVYPVPMTDLEKARGSTFKPFPPKNKWYSFDFSQKRLPTPPEIWQAINKQATLMLEPPIRNIGVKGIRKTAKMVPKWSDVLSEKELRWTLFNAYIFISAVGGTGGGTFRYMFSRFLQEAAVLTHEPQLTHCADQFQRIGDAWETVGEWFRTTSEVDKPAKQLSKISDPILQIADMEQQAWTALQQLCQPQEVFVS